MRESFLTYTGKGKTADKAENFDVIGTRTGLCSVTYQYENDDCVERRYWNADGQPTVSNEIFSMSRIEFRNHSFIRVSYFDTEGHPVCCRSGFAERKCQRDSRGNAVKMFFYGKNGELKRFIFLLRVSLLVLSWSLSVPL